MLFTTASNSAVRSSALVVVNSVNFDKASRSIVVVCSDGNRRLCRIDRCETIQLARDLYGKVRGLIDQRAIFHAAGGNDPSRWFFDVEGFDEDDTPDFIHGMKVDEPDYDTETAEEGAMSALAYHEDTEDDYELVICNSLEVVVKTSIEVTWLLVRYNFLFTEGNQTWADWAQLRHDLVMAKHTLESNDDYELSNTIEENLGNIKFIINDIEAKTLLLELEAQR